MKEQKKAVATEMVLGNFSITNSDGESYVHETTQKAITAWLQRPHRLGTIDNPRKKVERSIDMNDVCCTFEHPTFDPKTGIVKAIVRPIGPMAEVLRAGLKEESVRFKIHSFGEVNSKMQYVTTELISFAATVGEIRGRTKSA